MVRGVQSVLNAGVFCPVSTIHLIRHGQASFGAADYDRLSSLGEQQVAHLRNHYARIRQPVDAIYSGTLYRQRSTAEILASLYGSGGDGGGGDAESNGDRIRQHSAFNEYDAEILLKAHAKLSGLPLAALQGPNAKPDPRAFQRRLEQAGRAWITGELDTLGVEPWRRFRARVAAGLEEIMRIEGRSRHILVCSSAGTIGAAVGHVLGLDDEGSLKLSWTLFNASITRIRYDDARCNLEVFNAVPHLEAQPDPRPLVTFR
ncbi:MAG: histidine phosphatase family protein [Gammaproteobacteria bacterium]|nr:histidine phosphatase family protein [Gammaproteobacteria bacterium]